MPFMRAPNCATGPHQMRNPHCNVRPTGGSTLRRRQPAVCAVKWIEVPVEKCPDSVPGIALLTGVLWLPRFWIDATIEGVSAGRVVVYLRLGQRRLARTQRVDQLHVFL